MKTTYDKNHYVGDYLAGHEPTIMLQEFLRELSKARVKFPTRDISDNEDLLAMMAALTEEVGEFNQAIIQYLYEPEKNVTYDDIRKEARQCGAMVLRVMLDTKLGFLNPYGRGSYP